MYKVYDRAFKVGFCANILIFVILNIISLIVAIYESQKTLRLELYVVDSCLYQDWGFPLEMSNCFGLNPYSIIINIFFIVICGLILGLIFRFVWSKIKARSLR